MVTKTMLWKRIVIIGITLFSLVGVSKTEPLIAAETYLSGVSPEHAQGIVALIVQEVANKLGAKLEMEYAPFARRLAWMKSGRLDLMGGLLVRADRKKFLHYIQPPYVRSARKVFFVRKGDEGKIRKYEDLRELKIGTKIHSKYFPKFDRDEEIQKEPVSKLEQNFKKLMAGRIDAVIYSYRSGYNELVKMNLTAEIVPAEYFYYGSNPIHICISKKSPLMARKDEIEQIVQEMVESGEVNAIIINHYRNNPNS